MGNTPIEQYKEILDWLPRSPISSSGEKYDRYLMLTKIVYEIFTDNAWGEWDSLYPILVAYHQAWSSDYALPKWITISGDPRGTPRGSTYVLECLKAFGVHHIEKYSSQKSKPESFTTKDVDVLIWWWLNACETWRHTFWNFKSFPGRWVPDPAGLDVQDIKKATQSSAMLDILTFNRFSPRNHRLTESWELAHSYDNQNPKYIPAERVGCIAVRRFPWIIPNKTLFDELFTRICTIYGYTNTKLVLSNISQKTQSLCPHHHDTSR